MVDYDYLIETNIVQNTLIYFFSYLGIFMYFLSFLILLLCFKKPSLIKSNSFSLILLSSITNLFELIINEKSLFIYKTIITFLSYCFQFHLVFSFINKLLTGKKLFRSEKDFSLRLLIYIDFILSLIIFPYEEFFNDTNRINFFQNIIIIILLLCLYEYFKKKNNQVIKYLAENKKNIIDNVDLEEIFRIYLFLKNLCSLNFFFTLVFYIIKFLDIRLKTMRTIHFFISISLIGIKEIIVYVFFIGLTAIIYFLNKINKSEIIITEEEENNIKINETEKNNKKEEAQKVEIVDDVNNDKNNNNKHNQNEEEYKKIEKSLNEDNIIEIENLDISNGKEHTNNEEEKLDEEENSKINNLSKEADKLK